MKTCLSTCLLLAALCGCLSVCAAEKSVLSVAVYDAAPFGFVDERGEYTGLMVDMWEDISKELDLEYRYELTDMQTLLEGLESGRFDVGLGAITITPQREVLVDFSQPVNRSGTGIAVLKSDISSNFAAYFWPITYAIIKLALSLLGLLLISGILVWWVERRHPRDPGHRDIDTIEDGLWWSAVTISTIGYGDKVPRTRVGRVVGIFWIFSGLVMLSLFTANASAIFTVTEVESKINTLSDLRKVKVAAAADSSGAEFLERENIVYTPYENVAQAIEAMQAGTADCVVSNVPVIQYLNNTQFNDTLKIANRWLLHNNMGIALRDDSELREPLDQALLQLLSEPNWQNTLQRYLGNR